jgi:hypothetical protein
MGIVMRTNPAMALDAVQCNKPIYVQNDDWFREKDRSAVVHGTHTHHPKVFLTHSVLDAMYIQSVLWYD